MAAAGVKKEAVNRRHSPLSALTQKAKAATRERAVGAPSVDRRTAVIVRVAHVAAVAVAVVEDVRASDVHRAVRRISTAPNRSAKRADRTLGIHAGSTVGRFGGMGSGGIAP